MAAGNKTTKCIKITFNEETGVINYAEQSYIEDSDGDLHPLGSLHRPGPVAPLYKDSDDNWVDTDVSSKPQVIQDLATLWTDARKTAYENANS